MDINENNFKILTEYLANTLSPDPAVRRPGKRKNQFGNAEFKEIMK